jgi:AraC-like DNA-binding protein
VFYQSIIHGKVPYCVGLGIPHKFGEHRHADIEISYCVKGEFDVFLNKQRYTLRQGEFALINPMTAHAFSESEDPFSERFTAILGVSFLKNSFSHFANASTPFLIANNENHSELCEKIRSHLNETAEFCRDNLEKNDLLLRGNLYKICAYFIEFLNGSFAPAPSDWKEKKRVSNIEKALELIYFDYASPLTLEEAASATGYEKSNFCKIFKEITGSTFHALLNKQRVQSACDLLCQSTLSITEIARQVGLGETKTFCRVFKEITDMTPREYRKKYT